MSQENITPSLSSKALEIAIGEIGKQEVPKGSNWGPDVKKYLASVNINFPASWCMSFVYYCFSQAAKQLGLVLSLKKSGGVLAVWNSTPQKSRSSTPKVGSIIIFDHGHGLGHTGIVERIEGTSVHTIEGNTNDTGSREGFEVCRKVRKLSDPTLKGFIVI